jgi:hypothetical protein
MRNTPQQEQKALEFAQTFAEVILRFFPCELLHVSIPSNAVILYALSLPSC